MSEYLIKHNISNNEFYENLNIHLNNWLNSEDFKRTNDYYCDNIELIYNGERIEQYHVEADLLTLDDLIENNNMNVAITKYEPINYDCENDSDNNSD